MEIDGAEVVNNFIQQMPNFSFRVRKELRDGIELEYLTRYILEKDNNPVAEFSPNEWFKLIKFMKQLE